MAREKRLPRYRRVANPPPMRLTERDARIVSWVYKMRFLTREQIQRLEFAPTTASSAKKRLMFLYQNGYLERRALPIDEAFGSSKTLHCLDSKGADWLAYAMKMERSELDWKPRDNEVKPYLMQHLMDINDFRITANLAAQRKSWPLEWIDERTLKRDEMKEYVTDPDTDRRVAIVPDGYFTIDGIPVGGTLRKASFALEVDRGNMGMRPWKKKVRAYSAWWETGQYQSRYRTHSLRILTVVTAARRASSPQHEKHLVEEGVEKLRLWTEQAGGKSMFWFTGRHLVDEDTIFDAQIWKVARQADSQTLIGGPGHS